MLVVLHLLNLLESAGTTHDLTANSISSASTVGSPTIGQVHVLSANSITALASVSSPALDGATGFMDGAMTEEEWWARRRRLQKWGRIGGSPRRGFV